MIRLDPESSSEILRATHIGLIKLDEVDVSEWVPSGRTEERGGLLSGSIVELFKGELVEKPGDPVWFLVRQWRPAGLRTFVVPGVWSEHELEPGAGFMLFSVSSSMYAGEVFAESSLLRVELSGTAIGDVQLALRAGTPELSIATLIARCREEMHTWGFLFARYLDTRMPEAFFARFPDFDAVMRTLEAPQLSPVAARMLLAAAYTKLMLYDPAPLQFVSRLLQATQRLLQTSEGEPLREAVIQTFLPNLMGITGGLTFKAASDVLANDRPRFEQFLREMNAAPGVITWARS